MKGRLNPYKKLFRFFVITITILTANLLSDFLGNYLESFKHRYPPIWFSLMAMGIIVIIFFPAFKILDYWIEKLSKGVIESGKSLGGKYIGLILGFLFALIILTYCYLQVWYDINIFDYLFMGKIEKLI